MCASVRVFSQYLQFLVLLLLLQFPWSLMVGLFFANVALAKMAERFKSINSDLCMQMHMTVLKSISMKLK